VTNLLPCSTAILHIRLYNISKSTPMSLKVNECTFSSANDTSSNLNESDASNIVEPVYNSRFGLPNKKNDYGASEKALIGRIPTELLIYIFKLFVHDHDSPAVGILLFVCWHWHDLVENTPSLWSRIVLSPIQWESKYEAYATYIDKAVLKSHNLPLEIWADFTQISDESDDSASEDLNHASDKSGDSAPDKLDRPGSDRSDPPVSDPYSPTSLLLRTVGTEGEVMRRWKTFSLHADDASEIEEEFWEALCHPAPLLQELYLHITELFSWEPSVPALRTPVLDASGHLEEIDFSPDTLETLCFRLWSTVGFLRPFANLLSLAIDNYMLGGGGDDYGEEPVQLLRLEYLTIQWVHGWKFPVKMVRQIQAPALKTLRLLGSMAIRLVLKAACFHHIRDLHLVVEKKEAGRQEIMNPAYLNAKIAAYVALEEFTVARWHLKVAIEAVRGLQAKDQGPVLLRRIRTLDKDMKGEVIADDTSFARLVVPWKSTADFIYQYHSLV
jgi:F-box-like